MATRQRALVAGLVCSTVYLLVGVGFNEFSRHAAGRAVADMGRPVDRVTAYPTLMQPFLRRVVVRSGDSIFVGLHTALNPGCVRFEVYADPRDDPRVEDLRASREGRLFGWFALDDTAATIETLADGTALVRLEDLRYAGLGGPPAESMWGVVARYGPTGRRLSSVERFSRDMRARARVELLAPAVFGEDRSGLAEQRCHQATDPGSLAWSGRSSGVEISLR